MTCLTGLFYEAAGTSKPDYVCCYEITIERTGAQLPLGVKAEPVCLTFKFCVKDRTRTSEQHLVPLTGGSSVRRRVGRVHDVPEGPADGPGDPHANGPLRAAAEVTRRDCGSKQVSGKLILSIVYGFVLSLGKATIARLQVGRCALQVRSHGEIANLKNLLKFCGSARLRAAVTTCQSLCPLVGEMADRNK